MPISWIHSDDIVTVVIDLPESRNGLDQDTTGQLVAAIHDASALAEARFLVLRGIPGWFCIGGSGPFMEHLIAQPPAIRVEMIESVQSIILAVLRCPLLTVSVVDGLAAGAGVDMMLASDLALAGPSARLSLLYARLGLIPDSGFRLLQWRLGAGSLLAYADSKVLNAQQVIAAGLAHDAGPLLDDRLLHRELRRRWRHDRAVFAAGKALRNAELFQDIETDFARVARVQAELIAQPATRERLLHSAGTQRATA